jgi:hypothetical protein
VAVKDAEEAVLADLEARGVVFGIQKALRRRRLPPCGISRVRARRDVHLIEKALKKNQE